MELPTPCGPFNTVFASLLLLASAQGGGSGGLSYCDWRPQCLLCPLPISIISASPSAWQGVHSSHSSLWLGLCQQTYVSSSDSLCVPCSQSNLATHGTSAQGLHLPSGYCPPLGGGLGLQLGSAQHSPAPGAPEVCSARGQLLLGWEGRVLSRSGEGFPAQRAWGGSHLSKHLLNTRIFPLYNLVWRVVWKTCFLLLRWWMANPGPALMGILGPTPKRQGAKARRKEVSGR